MYEYLTFARDNCRKCNDTKTSSPRGRFRRLTYQKALMTGISRTAISSATDAGLSFLQKSPSKTRNLRLPAPNCREPSLPPNSPAGTHSPWPLHFFGISQFYSVNFYQVNLPVLHMYLYVIHFSGEVPKESRSSIVTPGLVYRWDWEWWLMSWLMINVSYVHSNWKCFSEL